MNVDPVQDKGPQGVYDQYLLWLEEIETTDPNNLVTTSNEIAAAAGGAWTNSAQQKESRAVNEAVENFFERQTKLEVPSVGLIDPALSVTLENRKPNTLNETLLKIYADNYPTVEEQNGETFASRVSERIRSGMKTEEQRRNEKKKSIEEQEKRKIRHERSRQPVLDWKVDGDFNIKPRDLTLQLLIATPV